MKRILLSATGACFLSAIWIVLSFPEWNLYPLIWICLVPWLFALNRLVSWKKALFYGWLLSILMNLGGFYWVAHSLNHYAFLPWPIAILGLLLFGLICQLQFPIYAAIRWVLLRKFPLQALSPARLAVLLMGLSLLYTGIDAWIPKLWQDTLGHSFYLAPDLRQLAEIGGPRLLTALVLLVNETLVAAMILAGQRNEPSLLPWLRRMSWAMASVLVVLLTAWMGGRHLRSSVEEFEKHPKMSVRMSVIQANIGDFEKLASEAGVNEAAENVVEKYLSWSREAVRQSPRPEVIVWPETAYPSVFRKPFTANELGRDQKIERFVRETGVPLFFGSYDNDGTKDYNAFFFLYPNRRQDLRTDLADGSDLDIYRKNILLLFGEYLPGAETFAFLKNAFPQVGNFGRGPGPVARKAILTGGKEFWFGPLVCYEILIPDYVIGAARQGSELILNVTNDSWFGPSGEPYLHFALSVFRGIETRLPQLRVTNTGVSALVLPSGVVSKQSRVFVPEILTADVPIYPKRETLMIRWGDWFGKSALLMAFVLLLGCSGLLSGLSGLSGMMRGLRRRRT